ncbi:hypothetical protein [Flagellimonas meridianipacifica]|uniref:N-acetylneuraminic acid synthase N-terminal domain-containing protein n=1 Tax=Flagellimonas meridianipacifica TaxID=1080225 RepID=A0A2T0MH75_9FLAO|nr:hypothetical protein [Allomuricauda pacifica]PRX56927.1 hypothetical protein CLV81_0928 [Allomuricauda pacifica]
MKIIAESAFNHNGSVEYLKKLAMAAKDAKSDYFTMQLMDFNSFCVEDYSKHEIYLNNTPSFKEWDSVFDLCEEIGLPVVPCVLDITSLNYCLKRGLRFSKNTRNSWNIVINE